MEIDLNPELFNEVYWELEKAHADLSIRFIWLMGGSSASKTYSEVQLTIKEMMCAKDYNVMVMRKFGSDIDDSIYNDFVTIIGEWGLESIFKIQNRYIECTTGSYVRFRGLDDSEKVKGISGFKKVILEEVNQFTIEDFKQIKKRLRGRPGQQIIGIFNPISEMHWIKREIFDKDTWLDVPSKISSKKISEKGNSVIFKSNYLDNYFIVGKWKYKYDKQLNKLVPFEQIGGYVDQHVIDDFENDRLNDYAYYEVYALGNWGKIVTGGEFYKKFRGEIHVKKLQYNKLLPLHISFDENVNPYFPCCIFQIDGKKIYLLKEVLGRNPNNTTSWICREIIKICTSWDHKAGVFIYGDATSVKDDVKLEKGYDLYRLITDGLSNLKPQRRISNSNPSVVMRGNFFNEVLEKNYGGIEFYIDENCYEAINDFYSTKEASDGRKDKATIRDTKTNVTYQPHGHITDLTDYLLCYAFAHEYTLYQRSGKATNLKTGKTEIKGSY
jgi:PBSX family phage terminase large subunit